MQLITRPKISVRRWLSFVLMAAGLALVIYVSVQYGTMFHEQKRLTEQWEQQNKAPQNASVRPVSDGLTRLAIPKISLDAVVVEGTASKQLLVGPGHLKDTVQPGENGNAVISAHRDTFFRHIYELNKGDVIEVKRDGNVYRYAVTGKKIVDPSDLSVLKPTPDAQLTLITCYPTFFIGPAPERLVVFSKLVERADGQRAAAATAGGTQ